MPAALTETDPVSAANLSQAFETLPPELKTQVFSLIVGFFRNTSGPDPETAKIVSQGEMHEETCRLEGYKESLKTRGKQSERDHEFRKLSLRHETIRSMSINGVCVLGIVAGLYLYIAKNAVTLGSNLMTGCFVALLGPKALLQKDKD